MEKTWWLKWGLKSFFNSFIRLRTLNIVCQLFRVTEIKEEWQKRVKTDLFLNDDYDKCKGWYQESNRKASQQQVPFGQWVGQWPHLLATGLLGPQRELQAGHCMQFRNRPPCEEQYCQLCLSSVYTVGDLRKYTWHFDVLHMNQTQCVKYGQYHINTVVCQK